MEIIFKREESAKDKNNRSTVKRTRNVMADHQHSIGQRRTHGSIVSKGDDDDDDDGSDYYEIVFNNFSHART